MKEEIPNVSFDGDVHIALFSSSILDKNVNINKVNSLMLTQEFLSTVVEQPRARRSIGYKW